MTIKEIKFGSDNYNKSIELRDKILRKPLGLEITPDFLEQDKEQFHIAAFENNRIVGILLLQKIDDFTIKMRQVAVDNNKQRSGIGQKLVEFSENFTKMKQFNKIELNARKESIPFYLKLNYITVGNEFIEVGIVHQKMEKFL